MVRIPATTSECPETFWGFIKGLPEYDIKGMHHDSFIKFSEGEKFIPFLRDLTWTIRKLRNSKLPLLTSDRPVFCNNRLGFPDGLLFMPLNPEIIFFAQPLSAKLHPILSCGSDNQVMRFCNEKIVGQANQYVWANHIGHQLFIERHLGKKPVASFNEGAMQAIRASSRATS
jgi:hypothetical protein